MSDSNPPDETPENNDDPFKEFDDWLVDGPAGKWPTSADQSLSAEQKEIVARNATLLTKDNGQAWRDKVERFDELLSLSSAIDRSAYEIHFDCYVFNDGQKTFDDYQFPCAVSFRSVEFGAGKLSFDGARFDEGEVSFIGATFGPGNLSFVGATFSTGSLTFRRCVFGVGAVRFDQAEFGDGGVVFEKACFGSRSVSFRSAQFGTGDVIFIQTDFGDADVSFEGAHLGTGNVLFSKAVFGQGDVSFVGTTFGEGDVSFVKAEFHGNTVDFSSATFGVGCVRLRRTVFHGRSVLFHGVDFGDGTVDLTKAEIERGHLRLNDLHIRGSLRCNGIKVRVADFSSTAVDGLADWSEACFYSIPDFTQMKMQRVPEVARMDVPPPKMTRVLKKRSNSQARSERFALFSRAAIVKDVYRLRKLKAMAIAANDHEKDGEFFAYEMMAKRGVEHTTFWQLLFNTIYWKVSFYGQSYLRPLGWLGASFATFAAIYSLMAALPIGGWQSLAFGITYSFKNSLPFLGTLTRSVPSPDGHVSWFAIQLEAIRGAQPGPDWFTVLGTGQAMLSLFFFFFLLLGLRNKFRLK